MDEEIINIKGKRKMVIDRKKLGIGTRIEMKEHGFNIKISRKIAMDHLKDNPNYYSKNKKVYLTSKNNGHTHNWRYKINRTSINSGHSHPLDFNKRIAKRGRTNHIHRLLKSFA